MPLNFPGNPNDGDTHEPGTGAKYVWSAARKSWEWDFFNLGGAKAPVARANGPYSGAINAPITFSSGGSIDRDSYIATYDWDFGDGSPHSSAKNPSHTYTASGSFTVTLVVTDNTGLTSTDTTSAVITEAGGVPPNAVLAGPVFGEPSVGISFNASGSNDPDGTIVKYDWDWGDTQQSLDAGATPSHTYAADGNYTVTVTVTDNSNLTDQATTTAFVATQGANPIPAENDLTPYTASSWELRTASTSGNNMGFARTESVNVGSTINFCVDGDSTVIDIVRVGEYDGTNHARKVATIANTPTNQPGETAIVGPNSENSFGGTDCTGWSTTASWAVPSDAVSGFYIAVVQGTPRQHIPFVVREDARAADLVILMPTNTDAAYNYYGGPIAGWDSGKSLYFQGPNLFPGRETRAYAVSKHKPGITREKIINNYVRFHMAAAQWFEKQGYNVKYITDDDLHGGLTWVGNSKTLVMIGHNEYWTDEMRDNLIAWRELGKHLIVMSGNAYYWRIVKDPNNPHIIWCKKRTHEGATGDTYNPNTSLTTGDPQWLGWTGVWYDQRSETLDPWGYTVNLPQDVIGQFFKMNAVSSPYRDIVVDGPTYQNAPFWRDTVVAGGTNLTLTGIFGFEGDEPRAPTDGRAYIWLADTPMTLSGSCYAENGDTVGTCSITAGFTISRTDTNHGVVFSGGSMNTLWALTDYHTGTTGFVNNDWQQAMVNLFADIGATADTLDVGLTTPTPVDISTYGFAWNPVAVISAPAQVTSGSPVAFDGTGSYDLDGTVVSYLWSFGDGTTSTASAPSYTYAVDGTYTATLTVTDNDGNTGQATHQVISGAGDQSLFSDLTPGTQNGADATNIVTGTRFNVSALGQVQGIRFWANNAMTPASVGLYEEVTGTTGTLLASKAVGTVTPNAWNQVNFDTPVSLSTTKRYVAALYLPGGNYPLDKEFLLSADYTSGAITAPQSDPINAGNGCYLYNATALGYPSNWGKVSPNIGTNYYVDVSFRLTQGNVNPVADAGGPYSAEPNASVQFDGSASYDPDGTIASYAWTFGDTGTGSGATPTHTYTAEGNYTVTLTVTDNLGASHQDTTSANISVAASQINIFGALAPTDLNVNFGNPYVLATRFEVSAAGNVHGIRVYTSQTNMVSEVALYDMVNPAVRGSGTGTLLASKAVASTVAGWNDILFDAPVAVQTGKTYAAAKLTANNVSDRTTGGFFNATAYTNQQLTAPATDVTNSGNGSYVQSATMAAPNDWAAVASSSQWYGVDVIYSAAGLPVANAGGPYSQPDGNAVTFDGTASTDPGGSIVQYDWDYGEGAGFQNNVGATPSHTYATSGEYTATLRVTDNDANTATDTASVTITSSVQTQPFFSGDATWGSQGTDAQGYVQGSFFTPTANGNVTEIHMYETADMAAGSLAVNVYTVSPQPPYSDQDVITCTPIGSSENLTLTGAAGWRTLTLATPVAVTAGTTYVVGCAPTAYLPNNAYVQEVATPPTISGFGTIWGASGTTTRANGLDRVRTTRYYPFDITFGAT